MSYHDRILQLDANYPEDKDLQPRVAFIVGHREGVEDAADIAKLADETIRCQQLVLDQIAETLGVEPGDVDGIGAAIDGLKEVVILAKGHIVEICTERNVPLPESIIRRIDKALAAGEAE